MSNFYANTTSRSAMMPGEDPKAYGKQQYDSGRLDSGFSEVCNSMPLQSLLTDAYSSVSGPPPPPQLIMADVEDSDSGITVDDAEKDCISTYHHKQPALISTESPMDVDQDSSKSVKASRLLVSPGPRSPVSKAKRAHIPRIPKKTVHGTFTTPSTSNSRTVSARSASPKSVYTTEPHSSTSTSSSSAPFSAAPFTINKENQGPSTLPAMPRSNSPLTCSNYRSLPVERVPPIVSTTGLDLYHLREYMNFFLPDTKEGDTGFHLAVIHNQPDLLDKLLFIMSKDKSLRPVVDEQNCLFQTALHLATHLQQLDIMRKLLLAGASIDITDHKGNTPLHIAAKFSSTRPLEEIVKYISIQTVLEVAQIRNNDGLSCVHVAAKNGNMEILRHLQHIGIDMDMQDFNSGKTALHLAAESNSLSNVQFLLETCEADVNSLTYSGCSPLHIASGRGDISVVAYLISMGADPELCTDEGDIALDLSGSDEVNAFLTKVDALKYMF